MSSWGLLLKDVVSTLQTKIISMQVKIGKNIFIHSYSPMDSFEVILFLGRISLKDITPSHIAFHWSDSQRKGILHQIMFEQNGELDLKLANRYYRKDEKVFFCDSRLECAEVS